jgi:hypothetical protein
MKRKIALAMIWMLGWAAVAFGQNTYNCNGQQETFNYALSQKGTVLTFPDQMTTVAATASIGAGSTANSGADLAPQSHTLRVTAGTYFYWQWKAYNAVSASSWQTVDGGSPSNPTSMSLGGTWSGIVGASHAGHTYVYYFQAKDANGNTTQDRVTYTVVAGNTPQVISADDISSNVYFSYIGRVTGGIVGGWCEQDINRQVIHQAQLLNTTSGEYRGMFQGTSAIVCAYCALPDVPVDSVSMLPGDSINVYATATVKLNCVTPIYASTLNLGTPRVELTWTQVQDDGQPAIPGPRNKEYYLSSVLCSTRTSPPDWIPLQVLAASRPSFSLGMTLCFRWPDTFGIPWVCAGSVAERFESGEALHYTTVAVPWFGGSYDCTNRDQGFSGFPLGVHWPFPM